ncbi:fasciclin domain-containing protein [Pseudahrensia aquimaris]|uniref:Fasciclin domain-containing protein n=1 Tax=Pseudahrensia aquimaris TaxID=744461 RepID=A0ABW3FH30_9HYPH
MKLLKSLTIAAFAVTTLAASAFAAGHTKTVVETAIASPDHKTLVAAVKAAGLVETLSGDGPFTVFAPIDAGFAELPAGTVETLLKPENKAMLQKVLTAHVVAGKIMAGDLISKIEKHGGYLNIKTVSGDVITARVDSKGVYIFDESGGVSRVTTADVESSNGVIHVVDDVLVPK